MNNTAKKGRFLKGLLIYAAVLVVLIFIGLFLFWKFIAAYEQSRTDGVMDRYMEQQIQSDLQAAIREYAQAHVTGSQSSQDIAAELSEALDGQTLTYRKTVGEFTQDLPVYTLRAGKTEIGKVRLTIGERRMLNFGFDTWELLSASYDFSAFGNTVTIAAPATVVTANGSETDLVITVNGVALTRADITAESIPPALDPYADALTEPPTFLTYQIGPFFGEPDVSIEENGGAFTIQQDGTSFSITQDCPEALANELTDYARQFVTAYIAFTSNAVDGPGVVQSYMIPGSSLYQRMAAAVDGMSWVHGVTAAMSGLTVDNFQYFGTAVLCDAQYGLTQNGSTSDNQMHIVLTQTENGWRVAEISMY